MVRTSFILSDDSQMKRLDEFIRSDMPTARYLGNPYRMSDGKWSVSMSYEIDDINKTSELFNQFYEEDNPKPVVKDNIFTKILKKLGISCI